MIAQRRIGGGVAFLGDGVNDTRTSRRGRRGLREHRTDIAKDAADVILLKSSRDVSADWFTEGRRIFANTMKCLMDTSSHSGNMFSAAGASINLPFLPMLPAQILLGNLRYEVGQVTIATDRVEPEQIRRPAHRDIAGLRKIMLTSGCSVFDAAPWRSCCSSWMPASVSSAQDGLSDLSRPRP